MTELAASFFDRPVDVVAPQMLGLLVGDGEVTVRLTEVEAYGGIDDPASHAFSGMSRRNASMFGPPGLLYCYLIYGIHICGNVVCGPPGRAAAVLLRAGEITAGEDTARRRRGWPRPRPAVDLARGPGRLARALGWTRDADGLPLLEPHSAWRLWAEERWAATSLPDVSDRGHIRSGPRVGVGGAGADPVRFPWRFWIEGAASVSPYRPGGRRRPPTARRAAPASHG